MKTLLLNYTINELPNITELLNTDKAIKSII